MAPEEKGQQGRDCPADQRAAFRPVAGEMQGMGTAECRGNGSIVRNISGSVNCTERPVRLLLSPSKNGGM